MNEGNYGHRPRGDIALPWAFASTLASHFQEYAAAVRSLCSMQAVTEMHRDDRFDWISRRLRSFLQETR